MVVYLCSFLVFAYFYPSSQIGFGFEVWNFALILSGSTAEDWSRVWRPPCQTSVFLSSRLSTQAVEAAEAGN